MTRARSLVAGNLTTCAVDMTAWSGRPLGAAPNESSILWNPGTGFWGAGQIIGLTLLAFVIIIADAAVQDDITAGLMADMGLSTDKIYVHGYHRVYPDIFRAAGLSRQSNFRMLEIGFGQGGSCSLWENVFPNAEILWIDFSDDAKERAKCIPGADVICQACTRSKFFFGSQSNTTFLESVVSEQCGSVPCFDLIIDDGGHGYEQQLGSFRTLFASALKPGGSYVVEDIETSYWTNGEQYGDLTHGGRTSSHTPVAVWKSIVDVLNSEFHQLDFLADPRLGHSVEKYIRSVSFAHNMLIARKKEPFEEELDQKIFDKRDYRYRHRVDGWTRGAIDLISVNRDDETIDNNWCTARMLNLRHHSPSKRTNAAIDWHDPDAISMFHEFCNMQSRSTSKLSSDDGPDVVLHQLTGGGLGAMIHGIGITYAFAQEDQRMLVEDTLFFGHDAVGEYFETQHSGCVSP